MSTLNAEWSRKLAQQFAKGFDTEPPSLRTIGREAEFPVVDDEGNAGDVQALLQAVAKMLPSLQQKFEGELLVELKGPRFILAAEVGVGTVELITGPQEDLIELEKAHLEGLHWLLEAAATLDQKILGLGIQPVSQASPQIMCPKDRYGVLLEALGPGWLWFTLTASDQVHIDTGINELSDVTNITSLLTALTVGLCGNSTVFHGQASNVYSAREHLMGQLLPGEYRHGLPAGPISSLNELMGQLMNQRHLMVRQNGLPKVAEGTFLEHLDGLDGPDSSRAFSDFLYHEHYIWNSSRPRSAQGTIELRSACQQPAETHMTAAAFGLALVESHRELSQVISDAWGSDAWFIARQWHHKSITEGLNASEPYPGLTLQILEICQRGLQRRHRDESRYLQPLFDRLAKKQNPAQLSRQIFTEQGLKGLINHAWIQNSSPQK